MLFCTVKVDWALKNEYGERLLRDLFEHGKDDSHRIPQILKIERYNQFPAATPALAPMAFQSRDRP
jgi:hypothetical protein